MPEASSTEQRAYQFIYSFFEKYGYGPNYSQVAKDLDISKSTVKKAVDNLIEVGMVVQADQNGGKAKAHTLMPAGVQITMPEYKEYEVEYLRRLADKTAQSLGTRLILTIDDVEYHAAGDGTYEGE